MGSKARAKARRRGRTTTRWPFWITVAILVALTAGSILLFEDRLRGFYARWRYPRIVLVTLDTLAVGYTGPYNPEVEFTPHLDALARQGALFRRAYTRVPITLPSHASLLSGLRPTELGVMTNGDQAQDATLMLPELLQERGYRTAAFTSLGVLKEVFNLHQGFDFYDQSAMPKKRRWYRTADEVFASAAEWIRKAAGDPFFVWIHFSDPHEPYLTPSAPPDVQLTLDGEELGTWNLTSKEGHVAHFSLPPGRHQLVWTSTRPVRDDDFPNTSLRMSFFEAESFERWLADGSVDLTMERDLRAPFTLQLYNDGESAVDLRVGFKGFLAHPPHSEVWENYRLEVEYADRYFGELRELFQVLELEQGTLWIVVSDHGEGLYRHGALGHASYGYEDQLQIVWVMAGPGVPAGRVIEDRSVLIEDVMPTLLDLLRLETSTDLAGVSQRSCWQRSGCPEQREWWAYGLEHDADGAPRLSAVAGYQPPQKILWRLRGSPLFFNLIDDPLENSDLGARSKGRRHRVPRGFQGLARRLAREREYFEDSLERRNWRSLDAEKKELLRSLGYLGN